jgi:hypothetical protein
VIHGTLLNARKNSPHVSLVPVPVCIIVEEVIKDVSSPAVPCSVSPVENHIVAKVKRTDMPIGWITGRIAGKQVYGRSTDYPPAGATKRMTARIERFAGEDIGCQMPVCL